MVGEGRGEGRFSLLRTSGRQSASFDRPEDARRGNATSGYGKIAFGPTLPRSSSSATEVAKGELGNRPLCSHISNGKKSLTHERTWGGDLVVALKAKLKA